MIFTFGMTPALSRVMFFSSFKIDEVNRTNRVEVRIAGKSLNVSNVIRTLGERVLALTVIGCDAKQMLQDFCDTNGIEHGILSCEHSTRVCITCLDVQARTATELVQESSELSVNYYTDCLAMLHQAFSERSEVSCVVFSGSLPPNAPEDFYADCVSAARTASVKCILDAKGPYLKNALPRCPFLVKPNIHELEATVGRALRDDDAVIVASRELCSEGAAYVFVTRGSASAILTCVNQSWIFTVPSVDVVSPIGSGDACAAGLAVGLRRGLDIVNSCRLGLACGCANAKTAYAGEVHLEDVDGFYGFVEVSKMISHGSS
eukprot:ANDGO_03869.mRNA.1 Tagatose-6-phosphate kinase